MKMNNIRHGEIQKFVVQCGNPKCSNKVEVYEHSKQFPTKEHYFCSSFCSHQFAASCSTQESYEKTARTIKKLNKMTHKIKCCRCGKEIEAKYLVTRKLCPECKHNMHKKCIYRHRFNDGTIRTVDCRRDNELKIEQIYNEAIRDITPEQLTVLRKRLYRVYRLMCSFTFSISSYPDEFKNDQLIQFGFYSAKNHGNNMNGVSRDHMYSVYDGFVNNISPIMISHPANCQLVMQRVNASKNRGSSITIDQLK